MKRRLRRTSSSASKPKQNSVFFLLKLLLLLGALLWIIVIIQVSTRFPLESNNNLDPREHFLDSRKSREFAVEIELDGDKSKLTSSHQNASPDAKATIAYAVSLTSCGAESLLDGAAVLKHSIHLSSIHNPKSGSKYSYKMIAIVHPQAMSCSDGLAKLGYEILERDTPVDVTQIQGEFLRKNIIKTGCCQEKELIKLWAYTLFDYPVVVHLDLDTLLLQPIDELFDAMIDGPEKTTQKIPVMLDAALPPRIDAFFTRDYNMVNPGHKHVGVQGGFFVIRPSKAAFDHYVEVILEGNFVPGKGWGGEYGGYYGAQQIQGVMSYFYDHLHPQTGVELNRCIYDSMADNPRAFPEKGESEGKCLIPKDDGECDDCREKDVSEMKLIHFTLCQKPWWCALDRAPYFKSKRLCNDFHREWFRIRKDLDDSGEFSTRRSELNLTDTWKPDFFFGFCTKGDKDGYVKLDFPS